MIDQKILTPYFLDQKLPSLLSLAGSDWRVIEASLPMDTLQDRLMELYEPLTTAVASALQSGRRPVSIAGDCCTTIPVLAGLQRGGLQPTLVWLDAHGDFNTWDTTPSGFLGGMPLAMIAGYGDQTLVNGLALKKLPESRIILCDARDLDPGEEAMLSASNIIRLSNIDLLRSNLIPSGPIYVHFDTDILDPADAPAMNYPSDGGPSAQRIQAAFARLAATGRIVAVSMSTWNPDMEGAAQSQRTIMKLLNVLLH